MTGMTAIRANLTRWYSRWEVMNQIGTSWGDVEAFLHALHDDNVSPQNTQGALELLAGHRDTIRLQLAAIMDVGLPLCQSCYRLEGDGYLAVIAFDEINVLSSLLMHHPLACAEAVASKIAQERYPLAADMPQRHQLRDNLMLEAQACVRPALAYLDDRFVSEAPNGLKRVKDVFALRVMRPAVCATLVESMTFQLTQCARCSGVSKEASSAFPPCTMTKPLSSTRSSLSWGSIELPQLVLMKASTPLLFGDSIAKPCPTGPNSRLS